MAADGTTTVVNRRDGKQTTDEFSLIEYNFSLFFGLAVQMYEATLVSDDTPFDRFLRDPGNNPLSEAAEEVVRCSLTCTQPPLRGATALSATPVRSSARPPSTRSRPAG